MRAGTRLRQASRTYLHFRLRGDERNETSHECSRLPQLLGLTGLVAFLWSLKSGQYDDLDGAAIRILPDDDIENERL
jgi:cbb3-type cytochrome oxidase maturation protein